MSEVLEAIRQQEAEKQEAQAEPISPAPWRWREREGGFVVLDAAGGLVAVVGTKRDARLVAASPINAILADLQSREFRARLAEAAA
jgi:hypothetical protein